MYTNAKEEGETHRSGEKKKKRVKSWKFSSPILGLTLPLFFLGPLFSKSSNKIVLPMSPVLPLKHEGWPLLRPISG